MRLVIVRHAIAVPRGTPDVPDDERPLTPEGEARFRKAARGLARVAKRPDRLLASPLPRAFRTAEIAAEAWGGIVPEATPLLAEGDLDALAALLDGEPRKATLALVGHEPTVSELLARLLASRADDRFTFRKGGACRVDLPGELARGGRLIWYLPPKVLRRLGGR